jgi:hypothetical protein
MPLGITFFLKRPLSEFDRICADWQQTHPGEKIPTGELFADWLAGKTGQAIIGGPAGEPPTVVAVPEGD